MRKILTILVVLSIVLVIAGCKPEEKKGFSPISGQPDTGAADNTTTANPETTAPAQEIINKTTGAETPAETSSETVPAETGTETSAPAAPFYVNDSYYDGLYDGCNKGSLSPDCCNKSVDMMKTGGFRQPTGLDCEAGYTVNRLSCMGSLRWCELTDEAATKEFYCDASSECIPKPVCHPKECINTKYSGNYAAPGDCPLPYFSDRAYSNSDCECINHKCTNKKA